MVLRTAGSTSLVVCGQQVNGMRMSPSRMYLFEGQQLVDTYMLPQEAEAADMDENGLRAVVAVEKNKKQCIDVYSLQYGKIEFECESANHELEYHREYISID